MLGYAIRRGLQMILVLFFVSLLVFVFIKLAPGDPARLLAGMTATPDTVEIIRHEFGLDRPYYIQFARLLTGLFSGRLKSLTYRAPIRDLIIERARASIELGLVALLLTVIISIPFGVISALMRGRPLDYAISLVALVGISTPVFWLAIILMSVFGVQLGILPISGRGATIGGWSLATVDGVRHLIIPGVALAAIQLALNTRLTRSSMLEILNQDYLRTARAKGLKARIVIVKHAFRNAMLPVLTNVGIQIGGFLGGAVLTETVTAWPGLGRLMFEAISRRDEPLIIGLTLLSAFTAVFGYIVVDLLYALVDPRITYE